MIELEGTFKGHLVQPRCNEQGHLQLDQDGGGFCDGYRVEVWAQQEQESCKLRGSRVLKITKFLVGSPEG